MMIAERLVRKLAQSTPRPRPLDQKPVHDGNVKSPGGGLIVFGSYVPKSTAQLAALCTLDGVHAIELRVADVLDSATRHGAIARAAQAANQALARGEDAVIFTSRQLYNGNSQDEALAIGRSLSAALVEVTRGIQIEPRFVVGKGGITSSDLATGGMDVRLARVAGQIMPGVPVWKLGPGSRLPGASYIVFPGNVGDEQAVARAVQLLRTQNPSG